MNRELLELYDRELKLLYEGRFAIAAPFRVTDVQQA